jgi:hypothetical protein
MDKTRRMEVKLPQTTYEKLLGLTLADAQKQKKRISVTGYLIDLIERTKK